MKLNLKSTFAILLTLGIVSILGLQLFGKVSPEIEEIARVASPSGARVAVVRMAVYGDHWFVNDARYEVQVKDAEGGDAGVLVYSTSASGAANLLARWPKEGSLRIEDSPDALRGAVKQPHPKVRIEYVSS